MRGNQLYKCVVFALVLLAACATAIAEVWSSGDGWDQPVAFRMPEGGLSAMESGQTSNIFYCAGRSLVGRLCASPGFRDTRADAVTADKDNPPLRRRSEDRPMSPEDRCSERPAEVGDGCDQPPGTRTEPSQPDREVPK